MVLTRMFNAECLWTLSCCDPTRTPLLEFSAFDMESNFDFVYIYDGDMCVLFSVSFLPRPNKYMARVWIQSSISHHDPIHREDTLSSILE
eukprot:SAG31_NODE_7276_length_1736_cov_2.824679_1_plen_90_part_00